MNSAETREKFLERYQKLFDEGLIEEIFHNKSISILNCADTYYIVTNYLRTPNNEYYGLVVHSEAAELISEAEENYYYFIKRMGKDLYRRQVLVFGDSPGHKTYDLLIKFKKDTQINGPSKYIDKELDARLKAIMNRGKR